VRTCLAVCVTLVGAMYLAAGSARAQDPVLPRAFVTVHVDQPIRAVPPGIFGVNVEWSHDGSGLWDAEKRAPFADRMAEVAKVGFGSLRYPGGTLSDYFHWEGATGGEREEQFNPFYTHDGEARKLIYPAYGPAEFLATTEALGAMPWITANVGTGTAQEAAAWAEWCRDRGSAVTHWEIGNEVYLKPDFPEGVKLTAAEYVAKFNEFADALRAVNADYLVCAIGQMPPIGILAGGISERDWNRVVIQGCAAQMDCLALHHAYAPVVMLGPDGKFQAEEKVYRSLLGASVFVRHTTEAILELVRELSPDRADEISLAVTEHEGLFYPLPGEDALKQVAPNRTLASAVYLATLYNLFLTEPKIMYAHKMTLITPVFGGVLSTTWEPGGPVWPNPHYWVCQEYARTVGQMVVACETECEAYSVGAVGFVPELADVPYVDATAVLSDGGELTVFLVSRSLEDTLPVAVNTPGLAAANVSAAVLSGPRYDATNDSREASPLRLTQANVTVGEPVTVDLPPCSLTVLRLVP